MTTKKRIHIIIVDPSAIIRCGLESILQEVSDLNADIANCADISSVLANGYKKSPDLIIVNPSQLGLFTPSQLRNEVGNENLRVVAIQSAFVDQLSLQNYDEVLSIYDSTETITNKISELTKSNKESDSRKDLSQREREIIVCVVKGLTNKQIADTLCLSTHTVIAHRRNIANKLQIHSPSGLTIYAIVNKLVDIFDIKNSMQGKEGAE